jgi:predicted transcriptional regulator
MKDKPVTDEIEFFGASPNRIEIISALGEEGPIEKHDLRERFDVSRTTLKRNLDKLAERGWIREELTNEYRITLSGQIVKDGLSGFIDAIEDGKRLQPFMKWVDPVEFDLDPAVLVGADVTVAKGANPYAPVNEHVAALEQTGSFQGCLPVVGRDALRKYRERLGETDGPWELVVTEEVLEMLRSDPNLNGEFEKIRGHDGLEIYVHEGEIPMFVGLFDDVVQIGVEDDQGVPKALVSVENELVRDWAKERYGRVRDQAEMLAIP